MVSLSLQPSHDNLRVAPPVLSQIHHQAVRRSLDRRCGAGNGQRLRLEDGDVVDDVSFWRIDGEGGPVDVLSWKWDEILIEMFYSELFIID